jgi:hypothetical protein
MVPVDEAGLGYLFSKFGAACGYYGTLDHYFGFTSFRKAFFDNVNTATGITEGFRQGFMDIHGENKYEIRRTNYNNNYSAAGCQYTGP